MLDLEPAPSASVARARTGRKRGIRIWQRRTSDVTRTDPTGPSELHVRRPAARLRGHVVMDVVVLTDGSVGDVQIVGSLDPTLGLDHEAAKAVRQWRFRAGTRAGKPIAMLVTVEMMFQLR